MKHLLIVTNLDSFFLSHWLNIAQTLRNEGYRVTVMTRDTGKASRIIENGFDYIHFPFDRSSLNPIKFFISAIRLGRLYQQISPDIITHVSPKICVEGSTAARLMYRRAKIINMISGLGYVFTSKKMILLQKLILLYLRMFISKTSTFFVFQNKDDLHLFLRNKITQPEKSLVIKGSGVNLDEYAHSCLPDLQGPIHFLLAARLLYDKGVMDYIQAARLLEPRYRTRARFILAGNIDKENPKGIAEEELKSHLIPDYIVWVGFQSDMVSLYQQVHVAVLPSSYREGLPQALCEAAAIGRPIITYDSVGCRECVRDGYNGYLVKPKDIQGLAQAMEKFILEPTLIQQMGNHSRAYAVQEFDVNMITEQLIGFMNRISAMP